MLEIPVSPWLHPYLKCFGATAFSETFYMLPVGDVFTPITSRKSGTAKLCLYILLYLTPFMHIKTRPIGKLLIITLLAEMSQKKIWIQSFRY